MSGSNEGQLRDRTAAPRDARVADRGRARTKGRRRRRERLRPGGRRYVHRRRRLRLLVRARARLPDVAGREVAGRFGGVGVINPYERHCPENSVAVSHDSGSLTGMRALARKNSPSPPAQPARRIASPANDGGSDVCGPMPQEAREGLERALCGVLARRYPGQRFAMKRQLDAAGQRSAPAADADGLKDAA
jgi:hypothetical protein